MLNIIWIIVDSVRNYSCAAERFDDRGRLDIMDDLAADWVDFRTVVTSAPSTLMSMGSMFTGWPAYHLGSAFDGLRISECGLPTICSCLKPFGYHSYCITHYTWGRECWGQIFDPLPKRLWAKGLTHRNEWTNAETNRALFHFLDNLACEPMFLFLHYNCRGDPRISHHVRMCIESLKDRGHFERSIIFLTSDHGYPDPLRREEVARRRKEIGLRADEVSHDLLMTDDNILVPLLVKYPGCSSMRIEQQICTLDYLPTSMELAGLRFTENVAGLSVVPLLRGEDMPQLKDRKVRIDGRFMAQTGRVTALRSPSRKYIVYPDRPETSREEFYDIEKDPQEVQDLVLTGTGGYEIELEEFRQVYQLDQERAREFQKQSLGGKYRRQMEARLGGRMSQIKRILYVRSGRPEFDDMAASIFGDVFPLADLVSVDRARVLNAANARFDLVHAGITSNFGISPLLKGIGSLGARHKLMMNLAMELVAFSRFEEILAFRGLWLKREWYYQEPMYFFREVWRKLRGH
jgi:hypothetical protein